MEEIPARLGMGCLLGMRRPFFDQFIPNSVTGLIATAHSAGAILKLQGPVEPPQRRWIVYVPFGSRKTYE